MSIRTTIKQAIHRYFIAQTFMTRLPAPVTIKWSEAELARSIPWFVAVGCVIGLLSACAWWVGYIGWSVHIAALFAVTASVLATGAFHEDGLADSADGIGGAFDINKKLAIMRDSRIGTYGSVALVLSIIGKVLAIALLNPTTAFLTIVGAHMLARWTSIPLIKFNHYVREHGTGKPFAANVTATHLIWGSTAALLVSLLCFGWNAAWVVPLVLCSTWLAQAYVRKKLGGITGDTLGAINSLTELLVYLIMAFKLTT